MRCARRDAGDELANVIVFGATGMVGRGVLIECMKCEWCLGGLQHLCSKVVLTIVGGPHGGFATHVRVENWQFAFPLPDQIESEHAGPLMCAGATVVHAHPAIRRAADRPGRGRRRRRTRAPGRAVSRQVGCDVTAVSSSQDKEEQARELGAKHFVATRGTGELRKAAGSFDFIFSTVSGDLPWDEYLAALRPQGKLWLIGIRRAASHSARSA